MLRRTNMSKSEGDGPLCHLCDKAASTQCDYCDRWTCLYCVAYDDGYSEFICLDHKG